MQKHGSWALLWAKRSVAWHQHVLRSENRGHILAKLLRWHDAEWLRLQCSRFVSSSSREFVIPRNSLIAGNTGTRVLACRPQKRFEEGVELAKQVIQQSRQAENSSNILGLHSVFQRASSYIKDLFAG